MQRTKFCLLRDNPCFPRSTVVVCPASFLQDIPTIERDLSRALAALHALEPRSSTSTSGNNPADDQLTVLRSMCVLKSRDVVWVRCDCSGFATCPNCCGYVIIGRSASRATLQDLYNEFTSAHCLAKDDFETEDNVDIWLDEGGAWENGPDADVGREIRFAVARLQEAVVVCLSGRGYVRLICRMPL